MIAPTTVKQIENQAAVRGISCQTDRDKIVLGDGNDQIVISSPGSSVVVQCDTAHLFGKICARYGSIHKNDATLSFTLDEADLPELVNIFSDVCLSEFLEDKVFQVPIPESLEETESAVKTKIRKGQAYLRGRAMIFWKNRCAVTGVNIPEVLEACHIKPWSCSDITAEERLSVDNTLILCAHLHRLFDAGFISFDNSGLLLISDELSVDCRKKIALDGEVKLSAPPSPRQQKFLEYHRNTIFRR